MCEILHGYNPLAMHQTMSTWGMICTPKEWKTPSSYSSVRHLQGKRYSTMLAGIPGPGFLIFRAGRVIEVPRTPLEAIAVATGISRTYLRISGRVSLPTPGLENKNHPSATKKQKSPEPVWNCVCTSPTAGEKRHFPFEYYKNVFWLNNCIAGVKMWNVEMVDTHFCLCPVRYRVFEESVLFRSELARFRIHFMKMVMRFAAVGYRPVLQF